MKGAWLGIALGAVAAGAAGIAVARRRPKPLGRVHNAERAHEVIQRELPDAERRARAAGAGDRKLTYVGAGAEGITFCDDAGRAYKVGRHDPEAFSLRNEAELLKTIRSIPGVRQHAPRGVRFDVKNNVIVRECLVARDYYRPNEKKIWDVYQRIVKAIEPYGYGKPEFKPDSFVTTRGRGPVLIDAGFAVQRGKRLVKHALDVINERKAIRHSEIPTLAWEIRMERDSTIPAPIANRLLRRLQRMNSDVEL